MPDPTRHLAIALPLPDRAERESPLARPELEAAVLSLYDLYRARLFRYVLSLGLSPSDGEEIIQEVFLAVFKHLRRGKSRANLRGWMFRVAHNLALKQLHAIHSARLAVDWDETIVEKSPDPALNPEERMVESQRLKQLRAVLGGLPRRDQCCLYLRAEGLGYREIAGILRMSLGAVANSLAKSFARFERAGGN